MIFIRPWFLIFLVVPFLLWLFKGKLAASAPLSKYIDERLLPFVTVRFGGEAVQTRGWFFTVLWSALVVAGAGPAYEKIPVPVKVSAPAHVIVMDMSPAMSGEALQSAKRKLYDLLGALKGQQAGLVVYDDKGYVVSPLTQDLNIIRTMIPALSANVMPTFGNRADLGFEKAASLFENVGLQQGQIIFLTAGGFDADRLTKTAQKLPFKVASIGFGTLDGTPVSLPDGTFLRAADGSVALVKLDEAALKKMGAYSKATVNDDDIHTVLSAFSDDSRVSGEGDSLNADVWRDLGPLMLLCIAPFFAFLFRRGVIYIFIVGVFLSAGYASDAAASEWFLRPDQQDYKALKSGVGAYHAGDYEGAKAAFARPTKTPRYQADTYYNQGNALAHLNDIQGAIAAYDKALAINPGHEAAKFNKEYLQKQLPPKDNQDQNNQDGQQNEQYKQQPQDNKDAASKDNQSEQNADENNTEANDGQENTDNQNRQNPADSNDEQQKGQGGAPQDNNQNALDQSSGAAQNSSEQNALSSSQSEKTPPKDGQLPQNGTLSDSNHGQSSAPAPHSPKPAEELPQQPVSSHEAQAMSLDPTNEPIDQEAAQLLNHIRSDPSRLLRYRLYQQWRQQNESF